MAKIFTRIAFSILLISVTHTNASYAVTIKNGVKCSKVSAIVKVGTKTYRCAKNPYSRPSINTWTSSSCLQALKLWRNAKSEYEDWSGLANLAGDEGKATLEELQKSIVSLEDLMKNEVCRKGA